MTAAPRRRGSETLERAPSQIKVARLLAGLQARPMNPYEIAEFLTISLNHARRYARILRRQRKLYIKRWIRSEIGGPPLAVYAAGEGKDAPRPAPMPKTEVHRRWYQKLKRERPAEYEAHLAKVRHKMNTRRNPQVKPDPMLSWIPRRELKEAA